MPLNKLQQVSLTPQKSYTGSGKNSDIMSLLWPDMTEYCTVIQYDGISYKTDRNGSIRTFLVSNLTVLLQFSSVEHLGMLWRTPNSPFTCDNAIYQWYSNVPQCTVCKVHHCAVCVLMHHNCHYVISTFWYRSKLHASQTKQKNPVRITWFQIILIQISSVHVQCW